MRHHLGEIGAAVRARRNALGLTQVQAVALAGVSSSTWSKVEAGRAEFGERIYALMGVALQLPSDWPTRIIQGETLEEIVGDEQWTSADTQRLLQIVEDVSRRVSALELRIGALRDNT